MPFSIDCIANDDIYILISSFCLTALVFFDYTVAHSLVRLWALSLYYN